MKTTLWVFTSKVAEKIMNAFLILDIKNLGNVWARLNMVLQRETEEANTYNCLDGRLRSHLSQAGFRRIHRRVHVHYDSFHRQCKSYVSLDESVESPTCDRRYSYLSSATCLSQGRTFVVFARDLSSIVRQKGSRLLQ